MKPQTKTKLTVEEREYLLSTNSSLLAMCKFILEVTEGAGLSAVYFIGSAHDVVYFKKTHAESHAPCNSRTFYESDGTAESKYTKDRA